MNTEEKAKAYDEAYKVAENIHRFSSDPAEIKRMEQIFPELAESEDERIRKAILGLTYIDGIEPILTKCSVTRQDIRAYLEEQGEQKPAWSEEDTRLLDNCISLIEDIDCTKEEQNWLKGIKNRVQPKQKWSEEDEINLEWLIAVCERIHYKSSPQVSPKGALILRDWLKSFKERVLPQQEWSEEDNIILSRIIADYERSNEEWFNAQNSLPHGRKINWLKSIRPQNTWKPSDEQMRVLDLAIRCGINRGTTEETTLVSLFNDLKKLKRRIKL